MTAAYLALAGWIVGLVVVQAAVARSRVPCSALEPELVDLVGNLARLRKVAA